ncbi:MAG: hypothetical protein RIS38_753 [Verrucomicrobiota bacterium]|jgi:hypothetical protein
MTDPDHDLEQALAALRPRPPGAAVTDRLARQLDAEPARRGVVIAWSAGLFAAAAAAAGAFVVLAESPAPAAAPAVAFADAAPAAAARFASPAATPPLARRAASADAAIHLKSGDELPERPTYRLVRADRSRPEVQLFQPVELADGSYARPARVRWEDTTRWEDAGSQARLIDHRPSDRLALLPLETH